MCYILLACRQFERAAYFLYSRKIVGWEVWKSEDAKHASELVKRIYRDEKIYIRNMQKEPLVLHSDNGSPMKGSMIMEYFMLQQRLEKQLYAVQ